MGREEIRLEEYRQLLQSLKGTAEGLLISQVSNVWNVYGGLNRLHHVMENIFKHGCRVFNQDGDPDCWIFIQGLSWLKPSLAVSPTFLAEIEENNQQLPPNINEKALVWLYKSLEGHTLSQKLSWLLSDREHLLSCFEKSAFLCQEKYGEATLICLRAVEQNQPSLLTEIDPCLYLTAWNYKTFQKTHRRCSSFPETQYSAWHMSRNRGIRFEKRPSEDSQLMGTMASSSSIQPASDIAVCCSGNSIEECSKIEGDRQSLCEEVTECTILTDNVASEGEVSKTEDTTEQIVATSENDTVMKIPDIPQPKLKHWLSLPCLVELCNGDAIRERSASTSVKEWSTVCGKPTKCYKSGSKTLPSSPASKSKNSAFSRHSCSSEPSTSFCETVPLSPCSKLSPSVLEIDYTSEQQSDADHGHTSFHKTNSRCWIVSKGAISKKHVTVEDECDSNTKSSGAVKRNAIGSSGSSDTLNVETNKSSDESTSKSNRPSSLKEMSSAPKPNIRPNELKLPTRSWVEVEGQSTQMVENNKKHSSKYKRHKNGIVGSAPESAGEWLSDRAVMGKRPYKKSFIEDGGNSVLPMATGFFPRPIEGQSLTSFLSSGQFARPSAELDRENAHFSISEAMIAAIEQVKCNRQLRVAEERGEVGDESDEEINHLKQRIRLRRRQRQVEKQNHMWGVSLLSDGKTDTTTTDQSVSPLSSSPGTPSDSISTDDVDDLEVDEVKNLAQLKNSGLSVSMASLYSEADLSKHPPPRTGTDLALTESVVSAEGVALSLIRQFSEKQLPRASDLQWLVSEQDAPQQLLPLPTSWPVSPDEAEDADMRQATPLRGTMEWAPPRPQVIFTPHPTPVRRVLMAKQNYRCAGCGMKVAVEYAHRFRYCEYLGRYFCTGCHTNQVALIPGKVLTKWDFTRYPVSSFSYRLLDQMMGDPLFRIGDLNVSLYRKARQLERTRQLRLQLYYLKDFVLTCRFAEVLQEELKKESIYLLTDLDVYSMQDLLQVKSSEMPTRFRELVSCSSLHVAECQLCMARGFVCELCVSKEVIFPWQLGKVTRCSSCGACFHTACWTPSPCPRCTRLSARRASRTEEDQDI